jgi:hypothetical protein
LQTRKLHIYGPCLSLTAASAGPASASQKTSPAQKAQVVENYGKLPLTFEANTGQADKGVKFLSRGSGYGLYLTGNEAVLTLRKTAFGAARPGLQRRLRPIQKSAPSDVVRMHLAGASGKAEPMGEEQLPGTANYFIGNDPAKWRTSIPTYAKVRYAGIYPGIDLVYHGNPSAEGQLEFDFVVASDADPRPIRVRFGAPNRLRLAANGDLVVTTANGALAFRKPLIYQIADGRRQRVAGGFALLGKHTVGFRLGSYDRAKALVIDPVLAYSTYLGGSAQFGDQGHAIGVDSAGNVYVAGQTFSTDFPVTKGAYQTTNHAANQYTNVFVTKLNATGTALVYSTYLGGSVRDIGSAIAVDSAGNAYVAGRALSSDFPVTQGAFQTTNHAAVNGNATAFVTKLNPTGTALVYSTYLGGTGLSAEYPFFGEEGNAIAVDSAGNAYVSGETFSVDLPVTPGAYQTTNHAAASELSNAFVTKLNAAGTALVYSTYLGGSGGRGNGVGDTSNAIAVDSAGNAYVAGETFSTDFPVTPGAYQSTNKAAANQDTNAFVTELNPTGTALVYSTYLGGSGGDIASAIAMDTAGNVYVAGQAGSTDFPVTQGAFQTTNHATTYGTNAFVTKLNPADTALVYSTYLGGSGGAVNQSLTLVHKGGDQASGLAIDGSGNAYVTGSTASADFPVTQGAYQTTNHDQPGCVGGCIGGYNAFITELNSTGSALVYSTYLGGRGLGPDFALIEGLAGDQANALALDSSGNVYVTGSAQSFDFPVTAGAFQMMVASFCGNAFIAKLNMGATSTATTPTVTVTPSSSTITSGQPLTVTVSVSGVSGNPEPTGTVRLASGTYASAPTALSGGVATINDVGGPGVMVAMYVPDTASSSTYNFSSGVGSVKVVGPEISATPSASQLTWAQAQSQALPVAIASTVATGYPTPTGTVTLSTGSWSSAATALSGGSATVSIPPGTLTTGLNLLYLSYSGDRNYAAFAGVPGSPVTVGGETPSFTITGTAVTVAAGLVAMSTITVTPAGGFTGSVALTAAITSSPNGAQSPPTVGFGGTSPVSISGAAAGTATLTISTTPANCAPGNVIDLRVRWYPPGAAALACLLLFSIPIRRRSWRTTLAMLAILVALVGGLLACGGGSSGRNCPPATTAGAYTVTVTGTSGSTTATGTVALTVQ